MLTNKKQAAPSLCVVGAILALLLAGCRPSGPDALLAGKRLLDRGQPVSAVRKLREATTVMPTNAVAWGYLGLAYHQSGSVSNAVEAYTRSLTLAPDRTEIRFNLGCLWMEQGHWAQAREQLTAATVLQKNSAVAWLRLGETQVRLGHYTDAVVSLGESLRLDANAADAWNWLGVAQLQLGRMQESSRSFQSALRLQTNHGPALLNLAILNQTKLKNPAKALELYRQYLAFLPNAANASDVKRTVAQLEAAPRPDPAPVVVAQKPKEKPPELTQAETNLLTARVVVRTNVVTRSEPPRQPAPPPKRATVAKRPVIEPASEIVKVEPPPAIVSSTRTMDPVPVARVTREEPAPTPPAPSIESESVSSLATTGESATKRGFFAKVNPLNLFKKKSKEKKTTPLPSRTEPVQESPTLSPPPTTQGPPTDFVVSTARVDVADAGRFKRYPYRLGSSPAVGDVPAAERAFGKAEKLRKRGRKTDAIETYSTAVQANPAYFAAQFNLGLLYLDTGELSGALTAFEAATRIQPTSAPARYNFALALKAANYPLDSANELLTVLASDPDDPRAHLTLGNLYAQRFGDKGKAREHYERVLELDPGHPQSSSIRFWLVQNPL